MTTIVKHRSPRLRPVGPGNSVDEICDALREAIVARKVDAGAFLREEDLAEEFGVSRTPIREALVRLETEQLVARVPRRGTIVRGVDTHEMDEIYMIRILVDGLAARLAAAKRTPVDVARLRWINSQMRAAAERKELDQVVERNIEFHEALCEVAGNRLLTMFIEQVHHWVRRSELNPFAYPNRGQRGADEHEAIVEAIAAGDGARAETLIREHMQRAHDIRSRLLAAGTGRSTETKNLGSGTHKAEGVPSRRRPRPKQLSRR